MDLEIRYGVSHELAAEQNTHNLLILSPLSVQWIVQQFICRDHINLAQNISTFHFPVWHLCLGNFCVSPKSNSSAAPVYHQSGRDSVFRTITKWVYCHNSLKHCLRENRDGDKPSSVFSCMSSIQFTAIQQKPGKEKKKKLGSWTGRYFEGWDVSRWSRAEWFKWSSCYFESCMAAVGAQPTPSRIWTWWKEPAGGRGEKQSWTALPRF